MRRLAVFSLLYHAGCLSLPRKGFAQDVVKQSGLSLPKSFASVRKVSWIPGSHPGVQPCARCVTNRATTVSQVTLSDMKKHIPFLLD